MKKDVLQLPEGYGLKAVIDLQKNKKQAFAVNLCALLIAAVMVFIAAQFIPISSAYTGPISGLVKLCVIIAGMVAYILWFFGIICLCGKRRFLLQKPLYYNRAGSCCNLGASSRRDKYFYAARLVLDCVYNPSNKHIRSGGRYLCVYPAA